jgi:hypothetical protein
MAAGNLVKRPKANRAQPGGAKHVPSAVKGSKVVDASGAIHRHIDKSQTSPQPQTPQTVGAVENRPVPEQAAEPVASTVPYTAGSPTGYSPYANWY